MYVFRVVLNKRVLDANAWADYARVATETRSVVLAVWMFIRLVRHNANPRLLYKRRIAHAHSLDRLGTSSDIWHKE